MTVPTTARIFPSVTFELCLLAVTATIFESEIGGVLIRLMRRRRRTVWLKLESVRRARNAYSYAIIRSCSYRLFPWRPIYLVQKCTVWVVALRRLAVAAGHVVLVWIMLETPRSKHSPCSNAVPKSIPILTVGDV